MYLSIYLIAQRGGGGGGGRGEGLKEGGGLLNISKVLCHPYTHIQKKAD